jgi:hypothetical protein
VDVETFSPVTEANGAGSSWKLRAKSLSMRVENGSEGVEHALNSVAKSSMDVSIPGEELMSVPRAWST